MDGFHNLVPGARDFLGRLAENNTREWFQDHKAAYEDQLKTPGTHLLDTVGAALSRDFGVATKPKLYRIHRDLRFSKDKTPYNTHLHLQWSMQDAPVCFLFGVSPAYCRIGVGAMVFPKDAMTAWRAAIDAGHPVVREIDRLAEAGWDPSEPELKRVPAPYPADHPAEAHLRRKGFVLWRDMAPDEQGGLPASLLARFGEADAYRRALAEAIA